MADEIDPSIPKEDKPSPEQQQEIDENESALRNNIRVKGKNSYYYAHKNNTPDEAAAVAWDGQAAPKLLKKDQVATGPVTLPQPITKYGWCDEQKKVCLYINFPGIQDHTKELVAIDWDRDSFSLTIQDFEAKNHLLRIEVYEPIQGYVVVRSP